MYTMPPIIQCVFVVSAGEIHLSFLIPDFSTANLRNDGSVSVCIGNRVVFTCKVLQLGILKWGIDPYFNIIRQNPIRFRLRDSYVRVGYTVSGMDGLFNATITDLSQDPNNNLLGNLTSELILWVNSTQELQVQCDDGTTTPQTIIVSAAGIYVF